jgi:hypothetical protein
MDEEELARQALQETKKRLTQESVAADFRAQF